MRLVAISALLTFTACTNGNKESDTAPPQHSDPPDSESPAPIDADNDSFTEADGDCDDNNAEVHPFATELCNGIDENCNGLVDEGVPDADGDGIGDCLDTEECDGIDNDGNGLIDDLLPDADADGICDARDTEECDGVDNTGDGSIDEGFDQDGDGFYTCGDESDCDDQNADIFPGQTEIMDTLDNDCDGSIDENAWSEGDLVISEVMSNPAEVSDALGEWIELYNASSETRYLNGLEIISDGGSSVLTDNRLIRILPGEYLVVGVDDRPDFNGQVDVDVVVNGLMLSNESGSLSLVNNGIIIDSVVWDDGISMPDSSGASMNLDSLFLSASANDQPEGWCASFSMWAFESDLGTPGEANDLCPSFDHDGDGFTGEQGDCMDDNPDIYPGAAEIWYDGIDSDCSGGSDYDRDGDGYNSADFGGDDCDDGEPTANPGALEVCDENGIDEDCNGLVNGDDPNATQAPTWYPDSDGDGYGSSSGGIVACDSPGVGYTIDNQDCEDGDASVNPLGVEVCGNGMDDNCDGDPDGCGAGGTTRATSAEGIYEGEQQSALTGGAITGVGDLNGDGYEDLAIGALAAGNSSQGVAYVVYGPPDGKSSLSGADVSLVGANRDDTVGATLSYGGDVDGDGVLDWWAGAPVSDGGGNSKGGTVYLISGTVSGNSRISNEATGTITGSSSNDQAGTSISWAGDIDDDGMDDVWVGAAYAAQGRQEVGQVYLMVGTPGARTSVSTATASYYGNSSNDEAGASVAGGWDLNGDGIPDAVVGAPEDDTGANGAGSAYVVDGSLSGANALSSALAQFYGAQANDNAGTSVAIAGDTNGDGNYDILVGAPEDNSGGEGSAYLILGPFTADDSLSNADGIIRGMDLLDRVGGSVASGGDVNSDGLAETLVGAPGVDVSARDEGVMLLLYGPWSGTYYEEDISDRFEGSSTGAALGQSVAGGFDADNDGFGDIASGAWHANPNGSNSGTVYLFIGGLGY